MSIKNPLIFFDLGDVLIDNRNKSNEWKRLARKSLRSDGGSWTADTLQAYFDSVCGDIHEQYAIGKIENNHYLEKLKSVTGYQGSIEDLAWDFAHIDNLIAPNIDIFAALKKSKAFHVGIISDTVPVHMDIARAQYPVLFDGLDRQSCIFSYDPDVQALKRHGSKVYEAALARFGVDARQTPTYMIDDREDNRPGAEEKNITFIRLDEGDDLKSKLSVYGISY